jgi:hypothetical protein
MWMVSPCIPVRCNLLQLLEHGQRSTLNTTEGFTTPPNCFLKTEYYHLLQLSSFSVFIKKQNRRGSSRAEEVSVVRLLMVTLVIYTAASYKVAWHLLVVLHIAQ